MKRIHTIVSIALLMLMAACDKGQEAVHVSEITLNSQALTLVVGDSEELTATVSPFNADNATILWTTSNASVAKVEKGIVKAIAAGTATITAKADDGGLSDVCEVTVISAKIDLKGITLEADSYTLVEGESLPLRVGFTPADATEKRIHWESSDSKIAIVDEDGLMYAVAPGVATIKATAEDGGHQATCEVLVTGKLTGLSLDKEQLDLVVEDEADLKAVIEPSTATQTKVRWTSTRPDVASVDSNGHIKALNAGKTIIIASTDPEGYVGFCRVSIREKVTSISLSVSEISLDINKTFTLSTTVIPTELSEIEVVWSSKDESIASVSASGLVTAKKQGETEIHVKSIDGPEASCRVVVIQPIETISISQEQFELYTGDTRSLGITLTPDNADIKTYHYNCEPEGIVTVENGNAHAKKAGETIVTIIPDRPKTDDVRAVCTIIVKDKVQKVSIVDPHTRELNIGETLALEAEVLPKGAIQTVTWISSNPTCASIGENDGFVKGLKVGTTTITAISTDDKEKKGSYTLSVIQPVESVKLTENALSIFIGEKKTLSASVLPDDASDKSLEWVSSDPAVVTVSTNGEITAHAEGSSTITVISKSNSNAKDECEVTVTSKTIHVTGITLNTTAREIAVGDSFELIPSISPSNAENKVVTWSTSDNTIAEVNNGVVTGKKEGEATIKVRSQDGGYEAECKVTVIKPAVPVTAITLSQSAATLEFGHSIELSAEVKPGDADQSVKWSSSNNDIASVTNGVVTAGTKEGTATITVSSVSYPAITASCKVTVKSTIIHVTGITLNTNSLNLYINQSKRLIATVTPSNADNKNVIWTAPSVGGVCWVDTNGNVTGIKVGNSLITAKTEDGAYRATCTVIVSENKVSSITINKSSFEEGKLVLKVGETYDMQAIVKGEDVLVEPSNPKVNWSIGGNGKIATIDSSGRVTALAAGTTTITATSAADSKKTDTCTLVVLSSNVDPGGAEGVDFEDWTF